MSYKPSEVEMISWLYGELEGEDKLKVDRYFQEHPEEKQKLHELQSVRDVISHIGEKEVIAPPLFMDQGAKTVPLWKSTWVRNIMGVAAALVLLLVSARLVDLQVSYSERELRIGFGPNITRTHSLTEEEVKDLIQQSNIENQQQFDARQAKLDETIRKSLAANSQQIDALVKQVSTASQAQVREFVATLTRDHLAQTRDYVQLSAADQRKYADNLIMDFAKYLQEQRSQDLNMFQTRFSRLEQNTDELKTETEQILASIISNGQQTKQSNY